MNHLTLRGTHREMGFQWGARLAERGLRLLDHVPFPLEAERREIEERRSTVLQEQENTNTQLQEQEAQAKANRLSYKKVIALVSELWGDE